MHINKARANMILIKKREVPTHKNIAANTYIQRYEDYFNNFTTAQGFASYHRISIKTAFKNLNKGKSLRESYFQSIT
jgi:hypothetical protein